MSVRGGTRPPTLRPQPVAASDDRGCRSRGLSRTQKRSFVDTLVDSRQAAGVNSEVNIHTRTRTNN